jgi:hypothetical protein
MSDFIFLITLQGHPICACSSLEIAKQYLSIVVKKHEHAKISEIPIDEMELVDFEFITRTHKSTHFPDGRITVTTEEERR